MAAALLAGKTPKTDEAEETSAEEAHKLDLAKIRFNGVCDSKKADVNKLLKEMKTANEGAEQKITTAAQAAGANIEALGRVRSNLDEKYSAAVRHVRCQLAALDAFGARAAGVQIATELTQVMCDMTEELKNLKKGTYKAWRGDVTSLMRTMQATISRGEAQQDGCREPIRIVRNS